MAQQSRERSRRSKEIALKAAEEERARIAAEPDSAGKRQLLEWADCNISQLQSQISVLSR